MAERYMRAPTAFKNLLSGIGGGGHGADTKENQAHTLKAKQLVTTQTIVTSTSTTTMTMATSTHCAAASSMSSMCGTTVNNGTSNAPAACFQMPAAKSASYLTTSASLIANLTAQASQNARNALGDIGNRLGVAPAANNTSKPPSQTVPEEVEMVEDVSADMSQFTDNEEQSLMDEDEEENEEQQQHLQDDDDLEVDNEDVYASGNVVDIDEYDEDNTQACADYVKDIYVYLFKLERNFRIDPNFLHNKIVTAKMRSVLVDWLIQVHQKLNLLNETLYLCMYIIDAYLQRNDVPKLQLQLMGVTALLVACKYEEMIVPAIMDFVFLTDNTYTVAAIRAMEIKLLKSLKFLLCKPSALNFLRRFSKAGEADPKQHTLAKYFMEMTLHDAEFSSIDPSMLGAAALCLSQRLLNGIHWSEQLVHYTTYNEADLMPVMHRLARLSIRCMDPEYKYKAIINKFRQSKFMRIVHVPELRGQLIRKVAIHATFGEE